ncbi:MAG: hypothetical protein ACQEWD_08075 [Bacteroidota bacterium]
MKIFFYRILSFTFFSSIFYIIMLFFWGNYAPNNLKPNLNYRIGSGGHVFTKLDEVKKTKNIDILFLGSSQAYRSFDPRIFSKNGLKTFNLGSSAQPPIVTSVLLKRYLERLNPKLIIYAVSPIIFQSDGVESSLNIIANDENDLFSWKMALEINNMKVYNTIIYGTIRDLLGLNNSFKEQFNKGEDTYISGGYVERESNHYRPVTKFETREIVINKTQLEYFKEMITNFESKNIDVLLVSVPTTQSFYASFINYNHFDSIMEEHSEYYNFNEILRLNDSLNFYDAGHLDKSGVKIFNKKLLEILSKNKVLTQDIGHSL